MSTPTAASDHVACTAAAPCQGEAGNLASGPPGGRLATHVDPAIQQANLKRLRRVEGQVRGVQRMLEEERYCADVLVQIASIQEALRGVSREVMRNHLAHCAAEAQKVGGDAAEAMRGELLDLMFKYLK